MLSGMEWASSAAWFVAGMSAGITLDVAERWAVVRIRRWRIERLRRSLERDS